jgi:thiamine transport system ATP-binding protein
MLELRHITKSFEGKAAVSDVSFKMKTGEIIALLGPSGSGKSTLLNVVAGLETPDRGQVLWDGKDKTKIPAHRRGFGLMFQDYALFPHRDVFGNTAFGLQMARANSATIAKRVREVLSLVGLSAEFEHRDIASLSGGEQQRVALARALAPQPRLLMLDEPLGSLDRALRTRLLEDLSLILRKSGQTSLYVTHDQEEAYAIADRIVLLNAGRVAQIATPVQLYRKPASAFVARFLGFENLFPARVNRSGSRVWLETPIGKFPAPTKKTDEEIIVLLRPDKIQLGRSGAVKLSGKLIKKQFRGNQLQARIQIGKVKLRVELPSDVDLPGISKQVSISFDPKKALQVFPRE